MKRNHLVQSPLKTRRPPGSTGEGEYYHLEVLPKEKFIRFTTHDIGRKGHTQRVAGQIVGGDWLTHKWLISKEDARVENDKLVSEHPHIQKIINSVKGDIHCHEGDVFRVKPFERKHKNIQSLSKKGRAPYVGPITADILENDEIYPSCDLCDEPYVYEDHVCF